MLAGLEDFVPEEALEGVEIDVGALEEGDVGVGDVDVLLVEAVDDEYVGGGELHASDFGDADEGIDERYLDDVVAAHPEGAGGGDGAFAERDVDLDLGGDVIDAEAVGHEGLHVVGGGEGEGHGGSVEGWLDDFLLAAAGGEEEKEGKEQNVISFIFHNIFVFGFSFR